MSLLNLIPKDRTMTKKTYKAVSRWLRMVSRQVEPAAREAVIRMATHGSAVIFVHPDHPPQVLNDNEFSELDINLNKYGELGKTVKMTVTIPTETAEDCVIGVDIASGDDWSPCPRCSGQQPPEGRACTYCGGTGSCYKGEPQHA